MKPIPLKTFEVHAILEGRKTQTRRIIKPQPESIDWERKVSIPYNGSVEFLMRETKAKYQPGDVLWVRETWTQNGLGYYRFYADYDDPSVMLFTNSSVPDKFRGKWKPSIHMPREAARLFLRVTDVRVERLQDISEGDAIAEGIEQIGQSYTQPYPKGPKENITPLYRNYSAKINPRALGLPSVTTAKESYQTLWEKINGPGSWDKNPFVWVYSFERIEK